jgi:hypothetical protein
MLLNLAEDLKDDCKITVSPKKEEKQESVMGERKPQTFEQMKQ